jgi:uncharacterized protein (TIGR03437 family)
MCHFGSAAELLVLMFFALSPNAAWGQSAKPTVNAVENVASYANGSISPGEMVVIFGTGMGPSNLVGLQLDQQGRVASVLSQVQVLFDGNPAPLIYVSAQQVSAMAPYGLTGKSSTQIQVTYQGIASDPFQKAIAASAPGIFTSDASGKGQAAMTNADGSYNTPLNPAIPGSYVTFYLTGEGQTNPPGSDGNLAVSTANVALPVTVLIAGRTAQLLYAGSAPGNVNGFAQVNAVIPADMPYGGNLPLVVQIGGVSSQIGVTLAVSGPPAPIPGTPQNLSASSNGQAQILLTWTPADGLATHFHVERQTAGTGGFTEIANLPAPAVAFTDQNVTAGVSYQYRVRAENDYGFSAYSAAVSDSVPVPLTPPPNLQAVAVSPTQISLTWSVANTNASQFHIERKTGVAGAYAEIVTVPNSAISYQDATVQPGTTYTYRMRSEGAIGGLSSYSSETSATTPALPLPPAPTLQGMATSSSQVHLSWSTTATGIVLFSVERRTTTGGYSQISQPTATSTSFDDSGLGGSTTYLYRMRVQTSAGFSPYSNEVTVTTLQAPPVAPTNLQATAISSSQVGLTWTNNAPDAFAIRLESQAAGAITFTDIGVAVTLTGTGVTNLQPNTTYSFRVRAQNAAGYSAYSNVATATTPALPLPPAPTLQGTATSSSQVHLSWSTTATGIVLFSVERRTAAGGYSQISQPAATSTSFDDSGLTGSTTYLYRMRVQTGVGFSPYSNEATITTLQALPAAPTNLQATAVSSSQINLTWTNNAPDATAIRVESQPAGSASFTDIGAAATLTSTGITNLQPHTAYNFRVRAQNAAGYSAYSNIVSAAAPITVFLVHGIGQGAQNMQSLKTTLLHQGGLDQSRFVVDATFDYSSCAANAFCSSSCTISNGGNLLATKILADTVPGSNIIIVGYSLGGLIARDMLVNNYQGITTARHVRALLTLGTPNLGYPYGSLDALGVLGGAALGFEVCPALMQQMASDFRAQQASRTVVLSPYLSTLVNQWNGINFPASVGFWLAISGGYCKNPIRTGDLTHSVGCPDYNPISDGVVCDQSARSVLNASNGPTQTWYGDAYAHTNVAILCGFTDNAPQLDAPMAGDTLSQQLWSTINGIR